MCDASSVPGEQRMAQKILCPTRGGQASYPNQDRAISIAKENQAELIFLYVSNIKFLDHLASPKVFDIETELEEMGEFLITMAIERAKQAGVDATGIVKSGSFRKVLLDVIENYQIDSVILGKSRLETSLLPPDFIKDLAKDLGDHTGIEFIIVDEGEVVFNTNE